MSTNTLAQAASAYLRSAMHQPIHWHEWNEEAFATAQRENKHILLDIGAVWCHRRHVMDHESYDDPEVARIVNENFIAVKVDHDERPDIETVLPGLPHPRVLPALETRRVRPLSSSIPSATFSST